MNKKKSTISSCIPVKVLIDSVDTYLPIFTDIINSSIRNRTFPEELKLAKVTPVFKKADAFDKVNYRPVSLMSHVSKVYERIIFNQTSTHFELYFSSFLTGIRKNHNTQHSLLKTLELWKETLEKDKSVCAIFMDLSKAFDTINHELNLKLTVSPKITFLIILLITFKLTYAVVYKEQILITISVYGKIFLLVFHKDLY